MPSVPGTASANPAGACDYGCAHGADFSVEPPGGVVAAVYILGIADVVFTGYDLGMLLAGKRPAQGAPVAELIIVGPQALLMGLAMAEEEGDNGALLGIMLWTGALTAHAIATLVWPADEGRPPPAVLGVRPTAVTDGTQLGYGLGYAGTF